MKIALICDWYLPRIGGLEMQVRDLARELNARGHETHVITATPEPTPDPRLGTTRNMAVDRTIKVHRLDVPLAPRLNVIRSTSVALKVERLFLDEGYDLVHAHSAFSPLAQMGNYVAKKVGIPSVLTEHSVLRGAGALMLRGLDRLYGWSTWPEVLTAVSTYVSDELLRATKRAECLVLPNGVDVREWIPATHHDGDEVTVVSTMRLTKRKRPIDIVRAIPRVLAALPAGVKAPKFRLIGGGPEEERVRREARRLGVEQHLEITGWRARPEVRQMLSSSSVFVLPTSKEALSIATLEALSAGLPVVAMNHGGVGDIISNGSEGFLVADSDEFVRRIVELVSDASLRRRMAVAGRARVNRFSWDSVVAQHLDVYRLALERRGQYGWPEPAKRVA